MRIILDANIYLSSLFSPHGTCAQIFRKLANDRSLELVLNKAICSELLNCFARPKILKLTNQSESALVTWLDSIRAIALDIESIAPATRICRDPKDEIYLSAAVASKASYLVTGDKDLLVLESIEETQIIGPGEFLRKL